MESTDEHGLTRMGFWISSVCIRGPIPEGRRMQRLGCVVLIIVLLVIGWDQWRIEQMRREIGNISGKLHVQDTKGVQKAGSDLVTALAETERHARRAKELLRKKRTSEAQAELDKALASLKSANSVSTDIAGDAAEFMGAARDRAVRVFQDAWKSISEEAKPKKIDVKNR